MPHRIIWSWYTSRWWVGCYNHGTWAGCGPAQSHLRCTKCNSPPINDQCTNFILFILLANRITYLNFSVFISLSVIWGPLALLTVKRTRTVLAARGFKHSSVSIWNSLPVDIRNSDTLFGFRRRLKTFLFQSAFATKIVPPTPTNSYLHMACN